MRQILILLTFLVFASISYGQEIEQTDSTFIQMDNIRGEFKSFEMEDSIHSPRLAAMYSAAIPGMGQFYNEKYWKIPIVYALGAFAASQIKQNHQNYLLFRNINFNLRDGNDSNNGEIQDFIDLGFDIDRTERQLQSYKRDRDYWIILSGLFYILQIVDATVDAHLREFDINEDLSINIQPSLQSSPNKNMQAGLSLNFRFK
ncbi:DUF5683 domain-containing protein [Marivirga sp.]|uniref:DUF5683 domain-containing protein n=1 Tax=Marivirga sp. TaxID=2018662 RepID=UPI002D7F37E3|nr:DUF5683 domain-containing protein [Marivirga sp.]HET8860190.1 DUF5683 domain-containing protein [Marivirga sp.]